MPITIGSNIQSLRAVRQLDRNGEALSRTFERLSSGQRINRASDDAAGLAISESLKARSQVYTQAVRNVNDGVSLLNIADGALSQLTDVVTRQRELSEQAANGTYGGPQRMALHREAFALTQEYNRIVQTSIQGARSALDATATLLTKIGREQGAIGALQSRLQTVTGNLRTAGENFDAARSRIIDADIARESAELTRSTILQQAASAVLAQANLQPELALRLLAP